MVIDRVYSMKHPNSVVFRDVSWGFCRAALREFDEQPSRISYDRGTLEIMTLALEHEHSKSMPGMMVSLICISMKLRIMHGGSLTLRRLSKQKGLEADQCYWVANEPVMRGKKRIDLRKDPPPDLVIEVDVMHSVVNRERICAALGVPVMWVLSQDAAVGLTTPCSMEKFGEKLSEANRSHFFAFPT